MIIIYDHDKICEYEHFLDHLRNMIAKSYSTISYVTACLCVVWKEISISQMMLTGVFGNVTKRNIGKADEYILSCSRIRSSKKQIFQRLYTPRKRCSGPRSWQDIALIGVTKHYGYAYIQKLYDKISLPSTSLPSPYFLNYGAPIYKLNLHSNFINDFLTTAWLYSAKCPILKKEFLITRKGESSTEHFYLHGDGQFRFRSDAFACLCPATKLSGSTNVMKTWVFYEQDTSKQRMTVISQKAYAYLDLLQSDPDSLKSSTNSSNYINESDISGEEKVPMTAKKCLLFGIAPFGSLYYYPAKESNNTFCPMNSISEFLNRRNVIFSSFLYGTTLPAGYRELSLQGFRIMVIPNLSMDYYYQFLFPQESIYVPLSAPYRFEYDTVEPHKIHGILGNFIKSFQPYLLHFTSNSDPISFYQMAGISFPIAFHCKRDFFQDHILIIENLSFDLTAQIRLKELISKWISLNRQADFMERQSFLFFVSNKDISHIRNFLDQIEGFPYITPTELFDNRQLRSCFLFLCMEDPEYRIFTIARSGELIFLLKQSYVQEQDKHTTAILDVGIVPGSSGQILDAMLTKTLRISVN